MGSPSLSKHIVGRSSDANSSSHNMRGIVRNASYYEEGTKAWLCVRQSHRIEWQITYGSSVFTRQPDKQRNTPQFTDSRKVYASLSHVSDYSCNNFNSRRASSVVNDAVNYSNIKHTNIQVDTWVVAEGLTKSIPFCLNMP